MSEFQNKLQIEKNIRKSRVGVWFNNILRPSLKGNQNSCINFEIGCGHGHWLTSYAQENPSQILLVLLKYKNQKGFFKL